MAGISQMMDEQSRLKRILEILMSHEAERSICAEHDILYLQGSPPEEMNSTELEELEALNCHWDNNLDTWCIYT